MFHSSFSSQRSSPPVDEHFSTSLHRRCINCYIAFEYFAIKEVKKDIGSRCEGRIGPHLNLSSLHSPYQAEIGHGYTDVWLWQRGCIKAPLPSLLQIYRRLLLSDQQISSIEVVQLKFKTVKKVINLLRKWFPLQLATACISEYLHVPLMIVANSTFWLFFLNLSLLGWIYSGGIVTEELSIIVWTPRIEKRARFGHGHFCQIFHSARATLIMGLPTRRSSVKIISFESVCSRNKISAKKEFLVQKHYF